MKIENVIIIFSVIIIMTAGFTFAGTSLEIISGRDVVVYGVTKEDIEEGFSYFFDKTKILVKSDTNWQVKAKVEAVSWPKDASQPEQGVLELRGNDPPAWVSNGIIQKGGSTEGFIFFVDYRVNLKRLGDASFGDYIFKITYMVIKE